MPLITLEAETVTGRFRQIPGAGQVRCRVEHCPLPPGQYLVSIWSDQHRDLLDGVHRATDMTVSVGDFHGTGRQLRPDHRTVLVNQLWSIAPSAVEPEGGQPAVATPKEIVAPES